MQTNLAYIDDVIDREVSSRYENASVTEDDRKDARKKATRSVAGFDVFDEDMERELLDKRITEQRKALAAFIDDRKALRSKLEDAGIAPLAIVPTQAWNMICRKADLFRLTPNAHGRVAIHPDAFNGLGQSTGKRERWAAFDWGVDPLNTIPWKAMLYRMFPDGKQYREADTWDGRGSLPPISATLVLPVPPEDVVTTLLKADRAGLSMKTAAVAEAISFKESLHELRARETARKVEEERRQAEWLADPIIYTEHGTATGVIAQFGDFPVEQEVVDAVVATKDLVGDAPAALDELRYSDLAQQYNAQAQRARALQTWGSSRQNRLGGFGSVLWNDYRTT